jgi:DNA-binding XRE family transcriptional regulator
MPQAVLAALAEVATREIIVIESEGRNPRLSTVIKLAAGLDLDPWELLEELIWRPHTDTAAGGFLAIEANGSETPLLLAGQPAIRSGG